MQNLHPSRLRWDDCRLIAAVSRAGTLAATARLLAIDATTASRRLTALERTLGSGLFQRAHGRLTLGPLGERLLPHALAMERAARALAAEAQAGTAQPAGEVRLSSPPTFARSVLAPAFAGFARACPDISVDLAVSTANVRLDQFEADLAVRLALPAKGAGIVVRRLGSMAYAPFAAAGAARPERWIGYETQFAHVPEARWTEEQLAGREPVLRTNDPELMAQAAAAGAGCALIPVVLGTARRGLEQVGPVVLSRDVWLLQHRDVMRAGHVRAVAGWIVEVCRDALDG